MAKKSKKAPGANNAALTKRYDSIAEIKREFFPNAAAEEEAEATARQGNHAYENLMDEFFGPRQHSPA